MTLGNEWCPVDLRDSATEKRKHFTLTLITMILLNNMKQGVFGEHVV